MTSTISLNKINSILKKNFRQNKAGLVLSDLMVLFAVLFDCSMTMSFINSKIDMDYVSDITKEFSVFLKYAMFCIGIVTLLVLSIKMFKEIYSKRASDFFYSMPVTRREYYAANVIYGLINIISMYVTAIISVFVFAKTSLLFNSEYYVVDLKILIPDLIGNFVVFLVLFACFILCTVLSGKIWQTIALSVISIVSFVNLISGIALYMNTVIGFKAENINNGIETLLSIFSGGARVNLLIVCIVRLIAAAVILTAGYYAFKIRRAEVAEQSLSGKIIPVIIFAFAGAAVFAASSFYGQTLFFRIIAGILASVVAAIAFCAVFYKKFITKSVLITLAVVCAAMSLFAAGVEKFPYLCGYAAYVPEKSEIQSVQFVEEGDNYSYTYYHDGSRYLDSLFSDIVSYGEEDSIYEIKTEDGIECVRNLHLKTVSQELIDKYKTYVNNSEAYNSVDSWYSFKIVYNLKNGKKVTRCYAVDTNDLVNEYADFIKSDEIINQSFPYNIDKSRILFARINENSVDTQPVIDDDYDIYYSEDSYFKLDDYDELFNVLKIDIKKRNSERAVIQALSYFYLYDKFIEDEIDIEIYYLSDDTPKAAEKSIREMKPSQIDSYIYNSEYNNDVEEYVESCSISLSRGNDNNSIAVLKEKEIIK